MGWKVYAGVFFTKLTIRNLIMTYRANLSPWAVFRYHSPENICVARFRKRNDADDYLRILRQLTPKGNFQVIFDQQQITPG